MGLPILSLAATLWAVVTPAPASPQATVIELASTYDEATCASLHADDDDWAHAAIGEATPDAAAADAACQSLVLAQPPIALVKLDCGEPAPWPGLSTCVVPRNNAHPRLRAANDHAPRPTSHFLAQQDATPPLAPPRTVQEARPLHLSALPALATPMVSTYAAHFTTPHLRSISYAPTPRPPEA